jgi:hypothetical protein
MPSATDFFNEIKGINHRLDTLTAAIDTVRAAVQQVETTLSGELNQLITLTTYTNQALYHNNLQNDTIICILEKIAKNTCDLVNEAHRQTALQTIIEKNTTGLAEMYAMTHAEAALAREREQDLRQEIEKCCPPEPPTPPCQDEPCSAPKPLGPPPQVGPVIG